MICAVLFVHCGAPINITRHRMVDCHGLGVIMFTQLQRATNMDSVTVVSYSLRLCLSISIILRDRNQ